MKLNDITVRQRSDQARLTALMKNVSLFTADLDQATANLKFEITPDSNGEYCQYAEKSSENQPSLENHFDVSFENIALNFTFDFQLEADSFKTVVQDQKGVGSFSIDSLSVRMKLAPYLTADKIRVEVTDIDLKFDSEPQMLLRTSSYDHDTAEGNTD